MIKALLLWPRYWFGQSPVSHSGPRYRGIGERWCDTLEFQSVSKYDSQLYREVQLNKVFCVSSWWVLKHDELVLRVFECQSCSDLPPKLLMRVVEFPNVGCNNEYRLILSFLFIVCKINIRRSVYVLNILLLFFCRTDFVTLETRKIFLLWWGVLDREFYISLP